ncbi:hypothetical protein L0P88_15635 [Muricauda sp. SCSIO 64092]|uniref:hypothetical protein n=1 Tax=Allomuricauda sp. SCSIO 64092 TaxID=2908842 RepID=UPI001FF6E73F|nr:hypothetical protein [Muricauda sp. SCSIO 64092]UOY05377.1 hypothetical protein L0P88_15635 [Muricauda sp. SCSIO 64092]
MPTTEYHALKNLKLYDLPENSRLCWAACLQMFIHLRSRGSQIPSIRELVVDYKNDTCYKTYETQNSSDNIAIHESCLIDTYDNYDIDLELYEGKIDFDFIEKWLNENHSPILVGLKMDKNNGHLVLVSGYAKCSDTRYLLFFDPGNGGSRRYEKFSKDAFLYQGKYEPVKYWLVPGPFYDVKMVKESFTKEELLKTYNIENNSNFRLDFSLPIHEIDFITTYDIIRGEPKSNYFRLVDNSTSAFKDIVLMERHINKSCKLTTRPYEPSKAIPINDSVDKAIFTNESDYKADSLVFLNSHSVQAYMHTANNGKKMILPVYSPRDYDLELKWQSYEDFKNKISSIEPPHTIVFNN